MRIGIYCEDKEDRTFDLELETVGVDINEIHNSPTCPKRMF